MAVLAKHQDSCSYPVTWELHDNLHVVTYGHSVKVTGCDLEAAHKFGECVRHSLECAGKFDNNSED